MSVESILKTVARNARKDSPSPELDKWVVDNALSAERDSLDDAGAAVARIVAIRASMESRDA